MTDHTFRVSLLNNAVTNFHTYGLFTIRAQRVNMDCFSREKPADCQRFERSLTEPFLLTVNCQAVILVGTLLNGAKETMLSVFGSNQPGKPKEENSFRKQPILNLEAARLDIFKIKSDIIMVHQAKV